MVYTHIWVPGHTEPMQFPQHTVFSSIPGIVDISAFTVSDLFDFQMMCWKWDLVDQLQLQASVKDFLCLTELDILVNDEWTWFLNPSGQYTVKSAYKLIYQLEFSIQLHDIQYRSLFWKQFWKPQHLQPKVRMFGWRLLTGTLPLRHNLARFIPNILNICPFVLKHMRLDCICFFNVHLFNKFGMSLDLCGPTNKGLLQFLLLIYGKVSFNPLCLSLNGNFFSTLYGVFGCKEMLVYFVKRFFQSGLLSHVHKLFL